MTLRLPPRRESPAATRRVRAPRRRSAVEALPRSRDRSPARRGTTPRRRDTIHYGHHRPTSTAPCRRAAPSVADKRRAAESALRCARCAPRRRADHRLRLRTRAVHASDGARGSARTRRRDRAQRRAARAARNASPMTDGEEGARRISPGRRARSRSADDEWGTFDVAHTRFVLEHVPDPLRVVKTMVRAVQPGGRIVLADDDHDVLRLWPEPPGFTSCGTRTCAPTTASATIRSSAAGSCSCCTRRARSRCATPGSSSAAAPAWRFSHPRREHGRRRAQRRARRFCRCDSSTSARFDDVMRRNREVGEAARRGDLVAMRVGGGPGEPEAQVMESVQGMIAV